jgi:hypothetical protein
LRWKYRFADREKQRLAIGTYPLLRAGATCADLTGSAAPTGGPTSRMSKVLCIIAAMVRTTLAGQISVARHDPHEHTA